MTDFEVESDRPGFSRFVTVIGLIISFAFVFGGMYMMGIAFEYDGNEALVFTGGITVDAIGFWFAFWAVHKMDAQVWTNAKKKEKK